MRLGLVLLCAGYVLSQFFRAFLAVLSRVLERDVGAGPEDLAFASGLWFLTFAAAQIPVGAALDRIGPRRTAAVILAIGGGGGAALFAMATTPLHIWVAMGLIGIGCSPVLMASYFIFARMFPAAMFATLGAVMIGVGSLGNLAGSAPLAWAIGAFGWRETIWGLSALSLILAAGIWLTVEDPPRIVSDVKGSVLDILRMPALWIIFPLLMVNYAPAAGLRGLWIGPYLADVHGATEALIGTATLVMGVAMIAGSFLYGPLDRILGTRKWVVFGGNALSCLALCALALWPQPGFVTAVILFAVVGLFGMSFPLIMAHGRSFVPPHLAGRGITLMNLVSIGGVGVMQVATGPLYRAVADPSAPAGQPYAILFGFFAVLVLIGLVVYLFSRDRLD
ncbi:MAG: MFS transporter [Rhodobacterales bacterium]|nr:MFS transporter [Rhodobacterales bacterium]MDX5413509.1 MFS transporter [Rhodobacterales bacterium]